MLRDIEKPAYRGLLLRRTFPQLQEIIDRCWKLYPLLGGVFRSTEKRWVFPWGSVIDLGHMQHEADKYNYQGKEYHRAGVDELTQFSESQYTYLISRLRTTDANIDPQIISTTNPGGIGHYWVKERFQPEFRALKPYIDPKTGLSRVFVPATVEDNPTLFDNDPSYLQRLETLPEIEKMRLRYGIWDAFEGQVFPELSQRVHGCEPFDIPAEWKRYCVLDWGYSSPFCVHWYAMDHEGILYLYREWYGCKKEQENITDGANVGLKLQAWEVGRGILDRENGEKISMRVADPHIWNPQGEARRRETIGVTVLEDMQREKVYFIKADNDRTHGKLQVHKRLQLREEIDTKTGEVVSEGPMFQAFNTCKGFWRTMPTLAEDPKNPEDVDSDMEDHPYDTFRYMCMARPLKPRVVTPIVRGTFQSERNKLIRARQYAQRHGVSLAVAYTRVR